MAAPGGASGWIESFLSSSTKGGSDLYGMATPPFLVAEIVKSEILPRVLSTSLGVAH
jgi:hypothetical protein